MTLSKYLFYYIWKADLQTEGKTESERGHLSTDLLLKWPKQRAEAIKSHEPGVSSRSSRWVQGPGSEVNQPGLELVLMLNAGTAARGLSC